MFHPLAREHLRKRNNELIGKPCSSLKSSMIELNQNINYFSASKYFGLPHDENEELSLLYLQFLALEAQVKNGPFSPLAPENLLFVVASEAINLVIQAFCEPGKDQICISSPTFPFYAYCAFNHKVDVINVPLIGDNFEILDVHQIVQNQPKVTFITIPNNPVGTVPSRECIDQCLTFLKGIVVVDEAYIEYSNTPSVAHLVNKYRNLIVLRSFSKGWGVAGIRSGVVVASREIIFTLKQLLPPCFFPQHTQEILATILPYPEKIFAIAKIIREERTLVAESLRALPFVRKVYPSETNFLLVQFNSGSHVFEYLKTVGILVNPFCPDLPNTLRISIGDHEKNRYLINALQEMAKRSR